MVVLVLVLVQYYLRAMMRARPLLVDEHSTGGVLGRKGVLLRWFDTQQFTVVKTFRS